MSGKHSSSYRLIASLEIFVSALSLAALLLFVPLLVHQANQLKAEIEEKSIKFKHNSDRVWQQIIEAEKVLDVGGRNTAGGQQITSFSRVPRSPWNRHICQGCHSLTCQPGLPGPGGDPGPDGEPGEPGKQGGSGEDGFDVQLQPEADMPCVICPAGPPGQRGSQGERGLMGEQGTSGDFGPEGKSGMDGPPGRFGPPGNPGMKGPMGRAGPAGDQVVAGVGIKGPQGPHGPAGPKGPQGASGKASRDVGVPGKPGPMGPQGPVGESGVSGENGSFGPPGEPGEPASYCPSDCGVSHIMAPSFASETAEEKAYKQKEPNEGYRRLAQKH